MDWYNMIAAERGMPPGWRWFELRAAGPDVIVTGAVCTAQFKSGPRKGKDNWAKRDRSTECEIVITRQQLDERHQQYERETGHCWVCLGTREEFAGWSHTEGKKTKPCSRCKATGKAPETTP